MTGGAIAQKLILRGERVVAISRRRSGIEGAIDVVGDCGDPAVLEPALGSADVFIHVAGILLGPRIAEAVRRERPKHLVVVSSAGLYSRHRSSVAAYRAGEDAIRAAAPHATFVRPTMIYGSARDRNIHHVVQFAARWRFLPQPGDGGASLQPIHYEDLADAVILLARAEHPGVVDAAGGDPITLASLLREVLMALGHKPRIVHLPLRPIHLTFGMIDRVIGTRLSERVARMTEDRALDITELTRLIGLSPRSFDVGVRDEIREMRGHGAL